MRIDNFSSGINFKRVIRISTNVKPQDNNRIDSYTLGILNTCAKNHTRFKNKKVTRKIREFLQTQIGDIDKYENTALRRFNNVDCFYYTGYDAKKYYDIMAKTDKKIRNFKQKQEGTKPNDALRKLYEIRDRKLMGISKEQSHIFLDIDEELGVINSINYISLAPSNPDEPCGFLKWVCAKLDKKDIYSAN